MNLRNEIFLKSMKEGLRFLYRFRFVLFGYIYFFIDAKFLKLYRTHDAGVGYIYSLIISLTVIDLIPNWYKFSVLQKIISVLLVSIYCFLLDYVFFIFHYISSTMIFFCISKILFLLRINNQYYIIQILSYIISVFFLMLVNYFFCIRTENNFSAHGYFTYYFNLISILSNFSVLPILIQALFSGDF